jgi:prepilin-type N-terminal cleavage/methylation domain-containing protein
MIRNNKGFTLIELMVVISIIGLLSSIVLASIKDARDRSVATKFKSEIQQFISALELYKTSTGKYPYEGGYPGFNSVFTTTIANNNQEFTAYSFGRQVNTPLSTLMAPYLKSLPRVPTNAYTTGNPAWIYYTNNPQIQSATRCLGDTTFPAYVILFTNQNPTTQAMFSNLPLSQVADSLGVLSTGTSRCFSLK